MRIIRGFILFPVYILVAIMSTSLKLIIKAECLVAGVGILLLAILSFIAIINKMWLQLCVFGMLIFFAIAVMFVSVFFLACIDTIKNGLR